MNVTAPTCTTTTSNTDRNVLTIAVTDESDSMMPDVWASWIVTFEVSVTLPTNVLGASPNV